MVCIKFEQKFKKIFKNLNFRLLRFLKVFLKKTYVFSKPFSSPAKTQPFELHPLQLRTPNLPSNQGPWQPCYTTDFPPLQVSKLANPALQTCALHVTGGRLIASLCYCCMLFYSRPTPVSIFSYLFFTVACFKCLWLSIERLFTASRPEALNILPSRIRSIFYKEQHSVIIFFTKSYNCDYLADIISQNVFCYLCT